jgi:hypothetical protein
VALLAFRLPVALLALRSPVALLALRSPVALLALWSPVALLALRSPVALLALWSPVALLALWSPVECPDRDLSHFDRTNSNAAEHNPAIVRRAPIVISDEAILLSSLPRSIVPFASHA